MNQNQDQINPIPPEFTERAKSMILSLGVSELVSVIPIVLIFLAIQFDGRSINKESGLVLERVQNLTLTTTSMSSVVNVLTITITTMTDGADDTWIRVAYIYLHLHCFFTFGVIFFCTGVIYGTIGSPLYEGLDYTILFQVMIVKITRLSNVWMYYKTVAGYRMLMNRERVRERIFGRHFRREHLHGG